MQATPITSCGALQQLVRKFEPYRIRLICSRNSSPSASRSKSTILIRSPNHVWDS